MSSAQEVESLRSDVVFVDREELLGKLKENREKHKTEFEQAHEEWKDQAIKRLREAADQAADGGEIEFYPLQSLPQPRHYLKEYDAAILRVSMDKRPELVLTEKQFAAWANDDWQWRDTFVATSSLYNNG